MYNREHSLYRPEAVQRYLLGAQKSVLPRLARPRILIFLWLLFALLFAGMAGVWFAQIPMYVSGQAVVVRPNDPGPMNDSSFLIVAFLPYKDLPKLLVGQTALVDFTGRGERLANRLTAVLPQISSPATARQRFALEGFPASAVTQPSAVAIARLSQWPAGTDPASYLEGSYPVEIQVGSRRLLSLLLAPD
jgi:hypothetical protein